LSILVILLLLLYAGWNAVIQLTQLAISTGNKPELILSSAAMFLAAELSDAVRKVCMGIMEI